MAKPTDDYTEHPLADRIRGLLTLAEVGRRAKHQPSTTIPEAVSQLLRDFRDKHMFAFGKKQEAVAAEKDVDLTRQELENKVHEAINNYLKTHPYNSRAIEAIDQFQANFGRVYDALQTIKVDDVVSALERAESDIRKPQQFKSLEAYVATLPASKDVRELFLPPTESKPKERKYAVIAAAVLGAALTTLVARNLVQYNNVYKTLKSEINSMYNVPGLTHLMPPARDWENQEPVIEYAEPTRRNVRDYLRDHPDLLSSLCPVCPPPELPLPIAPAQLSTTVSESKPSATPAEPEKAKPFNPGYDTQALPGSAQ